MLHDCVCKVYADTRLFSALFHECTLQMQCGTDSRSQWLSETNNSVLVMYPTEHAKCAPLVDSCICTAIM